MLERENDKLKELEEQGWDLYSEENWERRAEKDEHHMQMEMKTDNSEEKRESLQVNGTHLSLGSLVLVLSDYFTPILSTTTA